MGLSGRVAGGFQRGLAEEMARQTLEAERARLAAVQEQQLALQQQRFAEEQRQAQVAEGHRGEELKLRGTALSDARNETGLRQMNVDRGNWEEEQAQRELATATEGLPEHLRPIGGLVKAGVVRPSVEDFEDPEAREQRELRRITGIARAQRGSTPTDQQWVIRNGEPTPIPKGTAQPGDRPYDAVAARQAGSPAIDDGAANLAEIARLARELKAHKGKGGAFGVLDARMPTLRQDTADAEVLRDSLISKLTMENINKMKGVLSDSDIRILQQAATTLRPQMGDSAADAELDRLMVLGGGEAQDAGPATQRRPIPGIPGAEAELRNGRWIRVK